MPERKFSNTSSNNGNNYLSIINGMVDTAWVLGRDGSILAVNDSAVNLLGYTKEELIEKGLKTIDSSLTKKEIMELIVTMPAEKIQVFETSHRSKCGKVIPVEICSSMINYNGEQAILSIARDITERKWAEKEIKKQLEEKQTLLRAVHHRIKNNLASVESLLALTARTAKNPEAAKILSEAISRVGCIRILYELLLRTEDFTNTSVKTFFCKIVETLITLYNDASSIHIEWDVDEIILSETFLFPLGVILEELLINIFKYAFDKPADGIIRISFKKQEDNLHFMISDNGKGLSEDFDKKSSFGLVIVNMLARQIDAQFSIAPNPSGQGTLCTVSSVQQI